uniref:DinB/UmuC family translesion DNA polymerase n=1 Tax=Amaricoccus sp. TaxID=1872485 RepID=UPI002B563587|nr:DNA polymerase IV [Amaricoccus sp.]
GGAAVRALEAGGLRGFAALRPRDRKWLIRRFGSLGDRLWHLAQGADDRPVTPDRAIKSISHETTFAEDLADEGTLRWHLWSLAEQVSARAKAKGLGGRTVTLKLKRADHRILTRRQALSAPSQMAERIYRIALPLLRRDMGQAPFRLIGIGLAGLVPEAACDPGDDFLDRSGTRIVAAERTADRIRARFGRDSIRFGRSIR